MTPVNLQAALEYIAHAMDCRPLQDSAERDAASALTSWLGFSSHHDHQKNWDTLKCLLYITSHFDTNAAVLDAGSGAKSVVLRWLHRLGFRNLYSCDLKPVNTELLDQHGIKYSVQNLIETNYAANSFDAVTSVSVIEHNVPLDRYAAEMYRVIKPGGLLLTSTDYWSSPIDCSGIYPYGREMGEMKVFTPEGIQEFVEFALGAGFELCRPLDLSTREKAVRWDRVDRNYTFAFVALRKKP